MKRINKIIKTIFSGAIVFSVTIMSCSKDFLEKPLSNNVTIDTIFSAKIKAETFLWQTYNTCMPLGFPVGWDNNKCFASSMMMAACDEGDTYDSWPSSNMHNNGTWGSSGTGEDNFGLYYAGIRAANIYLENVGRVSDMPDADKKQETAEARVLRAIQYAELLKRYGGVPLVTKSLNSTDDVKLPRNTYEACVKFIVKECDEAAVYLPDSYPKQFSGRITKGAALAMKSRVLLYAASPLANSSLPYITDKRELTGYISYSADRWQKAADAAKAVLDWATSAGVKLENSKATPGDNYESTFADLNCPETILANQSNGWWGAWWPLFQQFTMPRGVYGGWYGQGVTYQQAARYYTKDGKEQVWNNSGSEAEFMQKMQEMEPRFQRSVFYSGGIWNDELGVLKIFKKKGGSWSPQAPVNGVGFMKKFLTRLNWNGGQINWIVFRLGEFYLNYAEALNEVSSMDPKCYDAINALHERAGIPDISSADNRYNTQEKLRETIRRERAIELAFEGHRFFDVRRWQIAGNDGVMKGQMWGLNLYEQQDGSVIYKKEPFETRVWDNKMYYYPFPQVEIDKAYIVQNPGW